MELVVVKSLLQRIFPKHMFDVIGKTKRRLIDAKQWQKYHDNKKNPTFLNYEVDQQMLVTATNVMLKNLS